MRANELKNEIRCIESGLEKITHELKKLREQVPEGSRLHVIKHGKGYQYYLRISGSDTNGDYIKKHDRRLAAILAQIEYYEKLSLVLQKAIYDLKSFGAVFKENPYEYTLNELSPGIRELVNLPYISDDNFIIEWKNRGYEGLGFKEGFPEYYTGRGLRVRSKSEVMIADILDEMYMPFLYEKPLQLNSGIIHPDFTLLNIKERKEVYWEHFGMMDDVEYRYNAFQKIKNYEAKGLYQFDAVIWTFETGRNPINTRDIRKMVEVLKRKLGY